MQEELGSARRGNPGCKNESKGLRCYNMAPPLKPQLQLEKQRKSETAENSCRSFGIQSSHHPSQKERQPLNAERMMITEHDAGGHRRLVSG